MGFSTAGLTLPWPSSPPLAWLSPTAPYLLSAMAAGRWTEPMQPTWWRRRSEWATDTLMARATMEMKRGRAIEGGVCKREELFVTSKLWNTFHAPEHVEAACRRSLDDLGLEYLDLYLIHFPISLAFVSFSERYPPEWVAPGANGMKFAKVPVSSTWAAMEKLVEGGMVKDIGLSNWSGQGLRDLLSYCKIRPAMLQVEVHPLLQCRRLVDLAKSEGIQVTAFSPLGNGQSYHMVGYQDVSALKEPAVTNIASKLGVTPAQVVLRWGVQRGYSVIPKSENLERMAANLAVEGFSLSEEEMAAVNSLEKGFRFNDPGHFCPLAFSTQCPIWD